MGWSPERGPNAEHSVGLAEGTREDRFKGTSGRTFLQQRRLADLWNQQNFIIHQGALYLCSMPKSETEDLLLFMVPRAHHVATLKRCHRDAGHVGCDCTLSLLQEHFWWPGMANQMQQSIKFCACCLKHEDNLSRMPLYPIVTTTPKDLLHVGLY